MTTTSWVDPGAAWLEELAGVLVGAGALEGADVGD